MKFTMTKKHLLDALSRMRDVSTKGLKSEFELAHRVTLQVDKKNVQFFGTNGHLSARWEVTDQTDSGLRCTDPGSATIDVGVSLGVVSSIGGSSKDILLDIELSGDVLHLKDSGSKSKKLVKIQTLAKSHKFSIKKPSEGFSFSLTKEEFKSGITSLGVYASNLGYKIRYQMVCLHFLKNETRFICGDGMRFVVYSYKLSSPNDQVTDDDGVRFLMPVDQASIVGSVLEGAERVDFIYSDEQTCYIKPQNAMEMLLQGIPNEKYIPYEKHAFCLDKARLILDAKTADFAESIGIVAAVKDREAEAQGQFHHATFEVGDGVLSMVVDEQKYQCDVDTPIDIYQISGDKNYKSRYAAVYLKDTVLMSKKPMLRFYCIDEKKSLIVEPIEVDDTNKKDGVPQAKVGTEDPRLLMFFIAIIEDEGNET